MGGINMKIKDIQNQLITEFPFALFFTRIIFDSNGKPIDYKLLEVNNAFEESFGLKKSDLIGKNLSEWLFKSHGIRDYWLNNLSELVLREEKKQFDGMLEFNNNWYLLTAFVLHGDYLIISFHNANKFRKVELDLKKLKILMKTSLEANQALNQSFFENVPISIIIYEVKEDGASGEDYIIRSVNPKALQIEGWQEDNIIGKSLKEARPGVDDFGIIDAFKQVWHTGQTYHYPAKVYRENEEYRWFENTIFKLPTGEIVAVYEDITEAKKKEDRIKFLNMRDSLTGLYNRAYFEEKLKELDNQSQLPLTFIMGDLDGLKLINDIFGHQVGDKAIIMAARIFEESCRETDIISRWGGDEFIILLPKTSEDIAQKICNRIREASNTLIVRDTHLSISLGYATKTHSDENWRDTLRQAEDNMYKSKLLGAQSYRNIVLNSMKNTLFEKSHETQEHGERLGRYCRGIGEIMGLTSIKIDELELLAMLHDIGKIAIDDKILRKPDKLTKEEWNIMKKHPEIGYRIACTVPELVNIAEYILAHHERWDGKGYPKGLARDDIPLLSRILAVVDAYDAMTQNRPYQRAMSPNMAKKELKANAGTQFDPMIVDIFINYLDNQNNIYKVDSL